MKTCPTCRAINSDMHNYCGVCGQSLSNDISKESNNIVPHYPQQISAGSKLLKRVTILSMGLVVTVLGLIVLRYSEDYYQAQPGLFVVLAGMVLVSVSIGMGGRTISGLRMTERAPGSMQESTISEDPLSQGERFLVEREQRRADEKKG
jgi:hypothetical protein